MDNMRLGTLTISGKFQLSIDGYDYGMTDTKQIRFEWWSNGFIRSGKLYKTLDPNILMELFGVKNGKYRLSSTYYKDKKIKEGFIKIKKHKTK